MGTASPSPMPGHRRADPDHAPVAVGQGASGVAGVERGVGLDDVLDQPRRRARARRHAPSQRRSRRRRSPFRRGPGGCRQPPPGSPRGASRPRRTPVDSAPRGRCARRRGQTADRARRRRSGRPCHRRTPPCPRPPRSTTWELVTRCPSPVSTTADPPDSPPPHPDAQRRHSRRQLRRDGGDDRGVGVQGARLGFGVAGHQWGNERLQARIPGFSHGERAVGRRRSAGPTSRSEPAKHSSRVLADRHEVRLLLDRSTRRPRPRAVRAPR